MERADSHQPELIEAVQKKLAVFPGVIFNYTSREDAVDEAKPAEERAGRQNIRLRLATLEEKSKQTRDVLAKVPGITRSRWCGNWAASLIITPDRAKLARYGLNVDDVNTLIGPPWGPAATR